MLKTKMRLLVIAAHPDDAEIRCGGIALQYIAQGHEVVFVSCTNGDTGHHEIGGIQLARRRHREAQAAAAIAGLREYRIVDIHSGELEPSVANRKMMVRTIREIDPDLIITHRPNDYHPDHRYTSQLVQDASYIVTVPNMASLTDVTSGLPRIFYMWDDFRRPYPFEPDVVVGIDDVIEKKIDMIHCHESQMYEWLPFNQGKVDRVPRDPAARREWLKGERLPQCERIANRYRERLIELYGQERGRAVRYAEAFEGCEYGRGFRQEEVSALFPFVGKDAQ